MSSTGAVMHVTKFRIERMDCAAEESEIRRALESVPSIQSLVFQLRTHTLEVTAPLGDLLAVEAALRAIGYDPKRIDAIDSDAHGEVQPDFDSKSLYRLALALALATAAEGLAFWNSASIPLRIASMAVAAVAIGLAGIDTYRKGVSSLRRGKLTITALMSVAVTGAFLIGQWPEAAMVMALYAIAEIIEARSLDRARNAIRSLLELAPELAEVRQPDGRWSRAPATAVTMGSIVRVSPGARVPLDGIVTQGQSAFNQAPVTGESIPVEKAPGDVVFAGTINETAEIELRVTATAGNTTLARIIQSVESAEGARAPTQWFIDRFAAIYTPCIFFLSIAVALLSPWFLGWTWLHSFYKALVLLVIGCPCALVISTPVTIVSALARAARRGILIKGGVYLEVARHIMFIALDKTGTITEGKPRLVAYETINGDPGEIARDAASLSARSDHPVSRAIAESLGPADRPIVAFKALAGRGVEGTLGDRTLFLGNHRLIEEMGLCSEALESALRGHEEKGRTTALLASSTEVRGLFAVADTIKPSSRDAITNLRELGVRTIMLTGDNQNTADSIAREAGIEECRGNLLPADKLQAIRDLKDGGALVAMTGDGINDAPALALSDVGIAMGAAGTDAAIEAADVVVMNDDLRRIPELIRLSKRTRAILLQNITFALGIKGVFLVLALFGSATMWMAVFADMGASLLVVANGLRLLHSRLQSRETEPGSGYQPG